MLTHMSVDVSMHMPVHMSKHMLMHTLADMPIHMPTHTSIHGDSSHTERLPSTTEYQFFFVPALLRYKQYFTGSGDTFLMIPRLASTPRASMLRRSLLD